MAVLAYAFVGFLLVQAPTPAEPTLDQVRAATERFRDVKVARKSSNEV